MGRLLKKCKICDMVFEDTTRNQNKKYCSAKCRYVAGNEQKRLKKNELLIYSRKCGKCGKKWVFDFCPIDHCRKYAEMKCPYCGYSVREDIRSAMEYQEFEDLVSYCDDSLAVI